MKDNDGTEYLWVLRSLFMYNLNSILMAMKYTYRTMGTCSSQIDFEVENGVLKGVHFTGGCNGNLKGISALVEGMKVNEVITRLEGIRCGGKPTSCPDQLCKALRETMD